MFNSTSLAARTKVLVGAVVAVSLGIVGSLVMVDSSIEAERAAVARQAEFKQLGFDLARAIPGLPQGALDVVRYHHERWDGCGYPHGLSGENIPLFGRIIGLADSFDAMSSNRTYRHALRHDQVITEITRCAGAQFDPLVVAAFLRVTGEGRAAP